jgi:hypothetical protein
MSARTLLLAAVTLVSLAQVAIAEPSSTTGCRRFVPSARTTVAVPCDDTQPVPAVVARVEKTATVTPVVVKAAPPVVATQTKVATPVQPEKGVVVPVASDVGKKAANRKICLDILERAQRGDVRNGDIVTLRETCQKTS